MNYHGIVVNLDKVMQTREYSTLTRATALTLHQLHNVSCGDFFKSLNIGELATIGYIVEKENQEELMLLMLLVARGEELTFNSSEDVAAALSVFVSLYSTTFNAMYQNKDLDFSKYTLELPLDYKFESLILK